jgi:WD40 repeat protein
LDGQFLVIVDSEKLKKWNIDHYDDQLLAIDRDDQKVQIMAVRPKNQDANNYFVLQQKDNSLVFYSVDTLNVIKKINNAHNDPIIALQFTSNAKYLFSLAQDNMIKIWDAQTFQ